MKFSGKNYLYFGDKGTDTEGRQWELHFYIPDDQWETVERVLAENPKSQDKLEQMRRWRAEGLGNCLVCGEHVVEGWLTDDEQFALCHDHVDHRHRGYAGIAAPERDGVVTIYEVPLERIEEMRAEARERNERRMRWEESLADEGKEKCQRCGGYGIIEAYRHVNGGVCFDCGGRGWTEAT